MWKRFPFENYPGKHLDVATLKLHCNVHLFGEEPVTFTLRKGLVHRETEIRIRRTDMYLIDSKCKLHRTSFIKMDFMHWETKRLNNVQDWGGGEIQMTVDP